MTLAIRSNRRGTWTDESADRALMRGTIREAISASRHFGPALTADE